MIEHVTPLPNTPAFVDGIVSLRGQVIPAMNLRIRFGFTRIPHSNRARLLVVNSNGRMVGLIVDSAREFISIPAETIQAPDEPLAGLNSVYLKGIVTMDERIIFVVNLEEVIRWTRDLEESRAGA